MNDYTKNGLTYCGKCNKPKQSHQKWPDGVMHTVRVECDCEARAAADEKKYYEQMDQRIYLDRMRSVGFPDREMRNWTFDKDDGRNKAITKKCKDYVANFQKFQAGGTGLLLYGTVGTGKTFYAACIANALCDAGFPALMTTTHRIEAALHDNYRGRREYIDSLQNFPLMVIDDLGTERNTEYMAELVQSVIDERYRAKLPLIVTTNLTPTELQRPTEITKNRLYSRLFEMCTPVKVSGQDRRKEILQKRFSHYNNLLTAE